MAQKLFAVVFILALTATAFSVPTQHLDFKPRPRYESLVSKSYGVAKEGKYQKITLQEAFNMAVKDASRMKLDATGDANAYVDILLAIVREYMDVLGLQTIALPDESVGFNTDILFFIPVWASVNLTNGELSGMNTIHRTGDATVTTSGYNVYINVDIGFTDPSAGYDITTDVEGIVLHGSVEATIKDISVNIQMFIDTENWSSYINSFDILDIGFITVTVTGLSIFNWLADIFIDVIANLLKGIVGNLLENTIQQIIQDVLDKIFPGNAALGGGFMTLAENNVQFQKTIEFVQHKRNDIFKMLRAFV